MVREVPGFPEPEVELAGIGVTVDNPAAATNVVLPANNATLSGTTQYLDATASSGVTKVIDEVSGWPSDLSDVQVATGTATYQAYGIDDSGHLQAIGNFNEEVTTNHLVAAWQDSTNCFGSDISRNAWIADSVGHGLRSKRLLGTAGEQLRRRVWTPP